MSVSKMHLKITPALIESLVDRHVFGGKREGNYLSDYASALEILGSPSLSKLNWRMERDFEDGIHVEISHGPEVFEMVAADIATGICLVVLIAQGVLTKEDCVAFYYNIEPTEVTPRHLQLTRSLRNENIEEGTPYAYPTEHSKFVSGRAWEDALGYNHINVVLTNFVMDEVEVEVLPLAVGVIDGSIPASESINTEYIEVPDFCHDFHATVSMFDQEYLAENEWSITKVGNTYSGRVENIESGETFEVISDEPITALLLATLYSERIVTINEHGEVNWNKSTLLELLENDQE
jgi:hypothetical protein